MNPTRRYKFLLTGLKSENGNTKWRKGVWKHEDNLDMCNSGFHCSKQPYQAFSYIQGEILAKVEVKGKSIIRDDKECLSDMRVVKTYKLTKKESVALAIYSAKLCLKNFEKEYPNDKQPRQAISAAVKYLKNPTKKNQATAWSAAWSAWSAGSDKPAAWSAWSAESAKSAAWLAAKSAWSASESAWLAAKSASESARSAAGSDKSAAIKKIQAYFNKLVRGLKEI